LTSTDRVARAVFALLVIACFAAFFVTQRLKHTPTMVQNFDLTPFFSPTPAGHIKQEEISFKLAHTDEVTVSIVNSAGAEVAWLVRDHPVAGYKQFSLRWNGRLGPASGYTLLYTAAGQAILDPVNDGAPAPGGEYRVRVSMREERTSVLSPRSFTLARG
jgi:hypothetical protein